MSKARFGTALAAAALMFSPTASMAARSAVDARAVEYRAAATSDAEADELFRGRGLASGGRLLFLLAGLTALAVVVYVIADRDNNASPGSGN